MEDQLLNQLAQTLNRHKNFVERAKYNQTLHFANRRLMGFVRGNLILNGIVEELEGQVADLEAVKSSAAILVAGNGAPDFDDEISFVLCSFYVLELCGSADIGAEIQAGKARSLNPSVHSDCLETFFLEYVQPFIAYIVDKLSNSQYILSNLVRFKQKTEWFDRVEVQRQIAAISGRTRNDMIENLLNNMIYRYLHDKGVEFYIEPSSAQSRGRVDLIGAQGSSPQLLLDGKYLDNSTSLRGYVIAAFNQVYNYTQQHNRPTGYIVLFKNLEQEIRFDFTGIGQGINYVVFNNKRIFFIVIDITSHERSTSQRGRAQVIEITENDLTTVNNEEG